MPDLAPQGRQRGIESRWYKTSNGQTDRYRSDRTPGSLFDDAIAVAWAPYRRLEGHPVLGQVGATRHRGAFQEHRNDRDALLSAASISSRTGSSISPIRACLPCAPDPLVVNENEHQTALGDSARDRLGPVLARLDRVHIHEDSGLAKASIERS
jgi:hypothetical protein